MKFFAPVLLLAAVAGVSAAPSFETITVTDEHGITFTGLGEHSQGSFSGLQKRCFSWWALSEGEECTPGNCDCSGDNGCYSCDGGRYVCQPGPGHPCEK
ncbi:hypothetical protein F5Y18DRAFT_373738 [Xylariaceae sp. FL1019]|nr:hypothetical protein F5Y18DRAFT_373738 [Xylariaceae sp. FL1019]